MAYTYNQEWAEPLTQQEAVVVGIGLLISENLSVPWQDGVSFFKTASGAGTVVQVQISEDLPMYSLSDSTRVGIGLALTDTQTLVDTVFYVHAQVTAGGNTGSRVQIGDSGNIRLVESTSLVFRFNLPLADNLNYWLDQPVPFFTGDYSIAIICLEESANWLDASVSVLAIALPLVDSITLSDQIRIGYGDQITDQLTLADALIVGYGDALTDSLTLSDSLLLGYGNSLTDSLTLSDSSVVALGLIEVLSDSLTLSDSFLLGYGNSIVDSLALSDSLLLHYGNSLTDQLTLSDSLLLGYGLQITDTETLSDAFASVLGGSIISESLSDALTLSDALAIGYGNIVNDQIILSDVSPTIVGEYDLVLTCPHLNNWSDSFASALGGSILTEQLSDTLVLAEQLRIGYGDGITDQIILSDVSPTIVGEYDLVLTCPHLNNWSDALTDILTVGWVFRSLVDQLLMSDSIKIGYGIQIIDLLEQNIQLVQDTFNRLNENPIDPTNWSPVVGKGSLQVVNNNCLPTTLAGSANNFTSITWPNDQWVEVPLAFVALGEFDIILRSDAGQKNCYRFGFIDNGNNTADVFIKVLISGVGTTLFENTSLQFSLGDVFHAVAIGTQLVFYKNGIQIGSANDPTYSSGTAGLFLAAVSAVTDIQLSNFAGGVAIPFLTESIGSGLGLGLTDLLSLSDQFSFASGGTQFGEFLTDMLSLSDQFVITLNIVSTQVLDSLVLSDQFNFVFELDIVLLDSISPPTDKIVVGTGISIAETLSVSDQMGLGYGDGLAEQLTLSDRLGIGYSLGIIEQLILVDGISFSVGGAAIGEFLSDTEVLTDQFSFATNSFTLSDTQTLSDQLAFVLELDLSSTDSLALSDKLVIGTGISLVDVMSLSDQTNIVSELDFSLVDSLVLSDKIFVGVGIAVNDILSMLDQLGFSVGGGAATEVLADILSITDFLQLGYGDRLTDSSLLTDQVSTLVSNVFITEQLSDSMVLTELFGFSIGGASMAQFLADVMVQTDQVSIIVYMSVFGDLLVQSEKINIGYGSLVSDQATLSDSFAKNAIASVPFVDSLSLSDALGLEYGLLIADLLTLTDSLITNLSGAVITESLSDTLILSDQIRIGYGDLITDQFTLVDQVSLGFPVLTETLSDSLVLAEQLLLGYGSLVVDTLTLSDSIVLGSGEVFSDTLTLSDVVTVGYGDALSDSLTMTDAFADVLVVVSESLSDSLTLSEFFAIGYGFRITDQLTVTESVAFLFPLSSTLAETLTLSDQNSLGYGFIISDALTLSDVLNPIGYGDLITDSLILSDNISLQLLGALISIFPSDSLTMLDGLGLGYGDQITDQLVLSEQVGLGYGDRVTDSLTLTDSFAFSYVLFQALVDTLTMSDAFVSQISLAFGLTDTLTMADILSTVGIGNQITEQLILSEGPVLGFGIILSDQMATQADGVGAGYGNAVSDQTAAQADQIALVEALLVQIADATPAQLDTLVQLFAGAMAFSDALVLQEQLTIMYGIIVTGDSITLADQLNPMLITPLVLALSDPTVAAWLDGILMTVIFAPSQIVLTSLAVFPKVVITDLTVKPVITDLTVKLGG